MMQQIIKIGELEFKLTEPWDCEGLEIEIGVPAGKALVLGNDYILPDLCESRSRTVAAEPAKTIRLTVNRDNGHPAEIRINFEVKPSQQ